MAEFKIKLELSLKKAAMISISQFLWKSSDTIDEITNFNGQILKPNKRKKKIRYTHQYAFASVGDLSFRKYQAWEKVIKWVLTKAGRILFLPHKLHNELREIIILMGQKIFYFYDDNQEVRKKSKTDPECFRCKKCIEGSGTEHFYSFSSHGTILMQCPLLHSKPVPTQDNLSSNLNLLRLNKYDENFKEFLDDVVFNCDVESIAKYEKEILMFLSLLQPGLSFKNKDETAFNIICLWKMMRSKDTWSRKHDILYDKNGYARVPGKYLSKSKEFTLPLEVVPQLCIGSNPTALQYFADKLRSLERQDLFFRMVETLMAYDTDYFPNKNLNYFPSPDYKPDKILKILNYMSSYDEKYDFLTRYLNDLFMVFLPIWPHQEILPKILDFCEENNIDLDYEFLFHLVIVCIGITNLSKFKARREFYVQTFKRFWLKAPDQTKFHYFTNHTFQVILLNPKTQLVRLVLTEEQFEECFNFPDNRENKHIQFFRPWVKLSPEETSTDFEMSESELNILEYELADVLAHYNRLKSRERDLLKTNFKL